ncbi:AMP-binding protein, partial [bacterium]|nr:AMP-binding protein [bacterium]
MNDFQARDASAVASAVPATGGIETLVDRIRMRAAQDGGRPFVTFLADGDRDERRLTFGELETRALAVAGALVGRGLRPGDRVLIMLPTGLEFVETFFGIALAGMVAVPVYPPARLTRLEHYLRTLASIAETSSCRAAVVDERLVPLVGKHLTFKGQLLVTDTELRAAREPGRPYPLESSSPAFMQFTSGTTSQPRGVLLLHLQVQAQLRAYCDALRVVPGEVVVSWLPLYHDLGLVGMVLASLHAGAHLILLSPVDFLKEPMTWLRAVSRHRAVHTAAPNFAYQLCVRKCSHEALRSEKIDLSSLENAGCGGEPVSWATIERFRAHFAPFGLRPEVLNPCYGLAENTLVATGHRRAEPLRTIVVSQRGLQANEVREPEGETDRATLVGNGCPFPGMAVRIAGPDGEDRGSRAIGEVWVQSPSLAEGYFGDREATSATFVTHEGRRWLRTGDLGFVADGDLYICGRKKDLMIVRGRNYHPQDLELEAGTVPGVRVGNVVAFSVDRGEGRGEVAIVVAEVDDRARRAVDEVRRDVIEKVSVAFQLSLAEVLLLPHGSIPKTSSGKLQRGLVKEAYLQGKLSTFAPRGGLATGLLKLRLAWGGLRRRLGHAASGGPEAAARPADGERSLDPRIALSLRRVRPEVGFTLTPSLRVDALGLDSLERVELWLQLARAFEARVPDAEWSSSQTLGELQLLLERHQGSAPAESAAPGEDSSLLVRELLAPPEEPFPPFRRPLTAPVGFALFSALSRVCWSFRFQGREHLEREGGFVLAGNHASYLDAPWIRNAAPPSVRDRLIAYRWAGAPRFTLPFLAQMRTIAIDPEGSFHKAIRAGLEALR